MIIGIIIGYVLRIVVERCLGAYGIWKESKARRQRGEQFEVDYLNCKIHYIDNGKGNKNKQQIGFVVNNK